MKEATLRAIVTWLDSLADTTEIDITFHGGEPLLAGEEFYATALPLLTKGLAPRHVRFRVQSNLWLITEELCRLFRSYEVSLGTSLDGPEHLNDAQRGEGYFRRTMTGIQKARSCGLPVACVCTFTAQSAPKAKEIFDFFASHRLPFTLQPAVPSLRGPQAEEAKISPESYAKLIIEMLDLYLESHGAIRISTLDALCRGISLGHGGLCTFVDCLGHYLAIDPEGSIYPCQRFVGLHEYAMSNAHECPSMGALQVTPIWKMFEERQSHIDSECKECPSMVFCRGGCPYDALASCRTNLALAPRDPYCVAYRQVFNYITDRALQEVFSEANIERIIDQADSEAGMLRQGRLLSIMRCR